MVFSGRYSIEWHNMEQYMATAEDRQRERRLTERLERLGHDLWNERCMTERMER